MNELIRRILNTFAEKRYASWQEYCIRKSTFEKLEALQPSSQIKAFSAISLLGVVEHCLTLCLNTRVKLGGLNDKV